MSSQALAEGGNNGGIIKFLFHLTNRAEEPDDQRCLNVVQDCATYLCNATAESVPVAGAVDIGNIVCLSTIGFNFAYVIPPRPTPTV